MKDNGSSLDLVAILRGLSPHEALEVGSTLYGAGLRTLEVPLNSPEPLRSIAILREGLPADCTVGAGTVLSVEDVRRCHEAGAEIIVAPNTDIAVVAAAAALDMEPVPGAATVTEVLQGFHAGARRVKVFPAEQVGPAAVRAWKAVLPPEIALLPVGGVDAETLQLWADAGAGGFGIGSALYRPGITVAELRQRAEGLVAARARLVRG